MRVRVCVRACTRIILCRANSGLEFVDATFKRNLENSKEEMEVSFTEAYTRTLKKHHNFLIAPIFSVRSLRGSGPRGE